MFSCIRQGLNENNITKVYDIFYGLDEQRIKTVYDDFSTSGHFKTRYYFGSYEKEIDEFGNVTHIDYIYSPTGLTLIVKNGTQYYTHTDLLGSIERVTNATGNLVSEYAYTPWGGRILLSGVNITDRGYTGHEHLTPFGDDTNGGFCLINMNGRVYDPVLGRFLSPDPYVQAPDFTQSFNRYAYGWNNPFKYTDPSGEFLLLYWLFFTNSGYEVQKIFSPVAAHFNWGVGSDVKHIGYEVSVGVPKLFPVSYRYHYGQTYFGRYYDDSYTGTITMKGGEWAINGYMFDIPGSITYSGTTFSSGESSQTTNKISVGNPIVNLQYENDYMFGIDLPGVPKGDGDRFRTGAVQINAGIFSIGLNMFTGEPDKSDDGKIKVDGHYTYIPTEKSNPDKYRFSALYLGIGSMRIGVNSEKVRGFFQNDVVHNITGDPYFRVLDRQPRFYWYFGTGLGSTLW